VPRTRSPSIPALGAPPSSRLKDPAAKPLPKEPPASRRGSGTDQKKSEPGRQRRQQPPRRLDLPSARRRLAAPLIASLGLLALLPAAPLARGHEVSSVSLIAYLDTRERTFLLDAAMEVVPSADDALNDEIGPDDAARLFAEDYLKILFDESEQEPAIEIHLENLSDDETPEELQRQQVLTQMRGTIPDGSRDFLLYLHPNCPMAVVLVIVKDGKASRRMQVVLAGEFSRPVNIEPYSDEDPFSEEGATATATAIAGEGAGEGAEGAGSPDPRSEPGAGFASSLAGGFAAFFRTTPLLPAFAASLFLLTLRRRPTLWQLAALLLGLGAGLAATLAIDPGRFAAAAALALSLALAFLGAEAYFHSAVGWWRLPGVFLASLGGGILLGQSSLAATGAAAVGEPPPLGDWLAWAAGAQSAAALTALAAIGALLFLSRLAWYAKWGRSALSAAAAAVGVVFLVERFL